MPTFRIKEAAGLLGVSDDTLRRWADGGRVETTTDAAGRLVVDGVLARLAGPGETVTTGKAGRWWPARRGTGSGPGHPLSVITSGQWRSGRPYRVVSLLSREAADELSLEPGMLAIAAIKATNVSVEIPKTG
jgi:excisionase family DNA binding protein